MRLLGTSPNLWELRFDGLNFKGLKNIGFDEPLIEVESIDGFVENDGSVLIDNEVIYYESVTRGPDAILTPGISLNEFKKKEQTLESPFSQFDGVENHIIVNNSGNLIEENAHTIELWMKSIYLLKLMSQ